jgi:hypothetical protein
MSEHAKVQCPSSTPMEAIKRKNHACNSVVHCDSGSDMFSFRQH